MAFLVTVDGFFSSRVQDGSRWRLRLFGRSELPFHQTDACVSWAGPGWFGRKEEAGNGQRRAVSGWDERVEDLARSLYLDPPAQLGTGTSIVIAGFFQPLEESSRKLEEIALGLMESTNRWFWPSLDPSQPTLQVDVRVYDNGSELYSATAGISPEVEPFKKPELTMGRSMRYRLPVRWLSEHCPSGYPREQPVAAGERSKPP